MSKEADRDTAQRALPESEELRRRFERFERWWNGSGFLTASVLNRFDTASEGRQTAAGSTGKGIMNKADAEMAEHLAACPEEAYRRPHEAARIQDALIRSRSWDADMIPHASTYIGPGSLCIFAGSTPESYGGSVWFHERPGWDGSPEDICFEPENEWWRRTLEYIDSLREYSAGDYYIALPDLAENWDIIAALMDPTTLLMEMYDRPESVRARLRAAEELYSEVYRRLYRRVSDPSGGSMYEAFYLWAPGSAAKLQCDGSAMFGPEMFRDFVLPGLRRQTGEIDYTMYHLDGTQSIVHLYAVLELEELNAVEWTPQAGQPGGTDPEWHSLYRRILEAGKSLQVLVEDPAGIGELLNAIGTEGIYLLGIGERATAEALKRETAPFR
jgi:5-methyltetrahydrofolate--homocysteine methyltransferase